MGGAAQHWHQAKLFIEHAVDVDHDSLHVIAGVLVLLAASLLLRRPVSSWRPWLAVLAVIVWSEAVDIIVERWPDPGQQYGEAAKDLVMTMLLPTVLLIAARLRPDLFRASPGRSKRRR